MLKSPFTEKLIETQTILLPDHHICIINVYQPFGKKDIFQKKLVEHLEDLQKKEKNMDILMVDDFNIDLLQDNSNRDKLIDSTVQLGFIQQVMLPTRIADTSQSLIAYVYTKSKCTLATDVITSNISDHFLTLTTYPNLCSKRVKNLHN